MNVFEGEIKVVVVVVVVVVTFSSFGMLRMPVGIVQSKQQRQSLYASLENT